jgi:hypothetical protein
MKTFKELVREVKWDRDDETTWGSPNPKVPFKGEYEVQFQPDSVTKQSWFHAMHDDGDKPGQIYVRTDWESNPAGRSTNARWMPDMRIFIGMAGSQQVDEKKFIAILKKHLAKAKKHGERVSVEVHNY